MKKLAWLTDLHLNFLPQKQIFDFLSMLNRHEADAIVISGDLTDARLLRDTLHNFHHYIQKPVYFVLGNHDFYHASFEAIRLSVKMWATDHIVWLTNAGVIKLTADTVLIGHDGWADGRLGDYARSTLELTDYYAIQEFMGLDRVRRLALMNKLGDEAADCLKILLPQALRQGKHVILVTHVPPFKESCWHIDRPSDDNGLPHFACKAVGEVLREVMEKHPEHRLTVLCGHTHTGCDVEMLPNLRVIAGFAEYGNPVIQRTFELV